MHAEILNTMTEPEARHHGHTPDLDAMTEFDTPGQKCELNTRTELDTPA